MIAPKYDVIVWRNPPFNETIIWKNLYDFLFKQPFVPLTNTIIIGFSEINRVLFRI